MAGVVVLDAGALIALFDSTDAHHDWALDMFVETAGDELVMSTLTYAEVLVRPIREGRADVFESSIDGLGIELAAVDKANARPLAVLRAETNLKMPDAIVLATAAQNGSRLATTDNVLAKVARDRGLAVIHP